MPADIVAPSAPANVAAASVKGGILISWNPSEDNFSMAGYRLYVDGVLKAETTETSTKVRVRRGSHEITVTAFDSSGNESVASMPIEAVYGK